MYSALTVRNDIDDLIIAKVKRVVGAMDDGYQFRLGENHQVFYGYGAPAIETSLYAATHAVWTH